MTKMIREIKNVQIKNNKMRMETVLHLRKKQHVLKLIQTNKDKLNVLVITKNKTITTIVLNHQETIVIMTEETNNVIAILTMMASARKTATKKVKKETVVMNKKLNQLFLHANSMNYQMY